ncbi:prepronociceptin [Lepisosteus oculatus]|uniref:Prepronociceptin b n=1 Tax=Lepisosteus oculatus TaxID=7918 RepID=W5NGA3_LEPOC|nr:PREDICTED: prepronociceptin [Lepisosteus oculatus]
MKTPLLTLLLLGLCVPGRCDCQRDCLSCSQRLFQQDSFNTLVCIMECEDKVSTSVTWDICRKATGKSSSTLGANALKRGEEIAQLPLDLDEAGLLYTGALKQFADLIRDFDVNKLEEENRVSKIRRAYHTEEESEERPLGGDNVPGEEYSPPEGAIDLTKRFGGFLKGKYGYRKLMDPGRSLQKRYGGFIGVRKSARKWNNQKRFSEFLKQYLGMSTRSSEYDSISADITEQNEI